ncbi:MAG: hypothetical protein ACE5LU_18610 [Anaerolineae bacterium]
MAVVIRRWLNLHPGSRLDNRIVTWVQGQIGRDQAGDFACGKHYQKLRIDQSGNWSCPVSNCDTRVETEAVS